MSRSLKYEIPGVDPRVALDSVAEKGWDALFARSGAQSADRSAELGRGARRVLEIGFGRGEFLLTLAQKDPEVEFLGIEVSYKRTLKMARKVARAGFENVRLVEGAAEQVLSSVCDPASLDAVWINFSDPWPKVRHGHRRVIQPRFVADVVRVLRPEGCLFVATDDVPYAHQIDEVLSAAPGLHNQYAPWPFLPEVSGRPVTGYEEQWRAIGRPMHFFAYGRAAEGGG